MHLLKRMGFFRQEGDGVQIGPVRKADDLLGGLRLVHDAYVQRGYIHPSPNGVRLRAYEAMPETATFVARVGHRIVGTISVVVDSPALGLPCTEAFGDVVGDLRGQGRRIAEATNWAVSPGYRYSGVLTELMRCALAYTAAIGCDDFVGAVCPGHARFFELLGFETVADVRSYSAEIYDPVALVRLDVSSLPERFKDVRVDDGDDEAFLKRYYVAGNPYVPHAPDWPGLFEALYRREDFLRRVFADEGDLLGCCSDAELNVVRRTWGSALFAQVFAEPAAYGGLAEPSAVRTPAQLVGAPI